MQRSENAENDEVTLSACEESTENAVCNVAQTRNFFPEACCIVAKTDFFKYDFVHHCNGRFSGNFGREIFRTAIFTEILALPSGELPFLRKFRLCKPCTCLYFFSRGIPHHCKAFSREFYQINYAEHHFS